MTDSPGADARSASAPGLFPGGASRLRARARNALRHPVRIGLVAGIVFLITLLALIVVPAGQRRAAEQSPLVLRRLDTLPILARAHGIGARRGAAQHTLDSARRELVAADSADSAAAEHPRRGATAELDSVSRMVRELSRLLARAERAPLPSAYRELAGARALTTEVRLGPLLDSLAVIERAQRAYGAAPSLDSGFVALSERGRAIGAILSTLARERRAALRGDAPEDTLRLRARLDTLAREGDATERQLVLARQVNARSLAALTAARDVANVNAPPLAMLVAALALGLALGGAASLGLELASPRLADEVDVWHAMGAEIIGNVPEEDGSARREAAERLLGRVASPLIPGTRIAVVSADSADAALAAVALATTAAAAGRSVLFVDTDTHGARSTMLLRRAATPGVSDVLGRGGDWESVLQAHVGSHTPPLDLLSPGAPLKSAPGTIAMDDAARALALIADSYDLTIVTVTAADTAIAEALLAPAGITAALVVAERGQTSLASLRRMRDRLASRGVAVRGVAIVTRA